MRHVRVIVTEVGVEVNAARVIVGNSPSCVDQHTRQAMRQVIESEVPEDHRPEDLEVVLDRGYWWTDQPREEYSVLVLSPERIEYVDPPTVEIDIEGGCVTRVDTPPSIRVKVRDYDARGIDDGRVVTDPNGRPCVEMTWGEAVADE